MLAKYHQPSPYSCWETDLNTKSEPKSPSAPDKHADAHVGAHADQTVKAIIVKLHKGVQMNNCAKVFCKPCRHVDLRAQTSSIFDHFIIWPSSVTLTFNLPEQIFQMALLLLKENNCDILFWNPYINVEVMAQTSNLWPFYQLTFKCDLQPTWTNVPHATATPQGD